MKYKAVKLISLQAVYRAGDNDYEGFRKEFNSFFHWCFRQWGMTSSFYAAVDFNVLEPELEKHPKWRDFLLGGGFIKRVEEETFYSAGDRFRHKGGHEYMLAVVGVGDLVRLIRADGKGILSGAAPAMSVGNVAMITKKEFEKLAYNFLEYFTKIEEGKYGGTNGG